ncbi:MAG: HAMP domain-containing sensor histidine kinase [Celeribacter sp.]
MLDTNLSPLLPTLARVLPSSDMAVGTGAIRVAQLTADGDATTGVTDLSPRGLPSGGIGAGLNATALTELAIAIGFLSVGAALLLLERKGDLKRPWICALMAAMMVLVGVYHLMSSMGPAPYLLTASLAVATLTVGAFFWANLPAMIASPGPQRLAETYAILQEEFDRRMTVKEDLRYAHEALQTAHSDLEQRVIERTAALCAANTEMERFIHVASHDLRAPLRALMVLPGWLRETITSLHGAVHEDLELDLREMEVQSQRMERLLCDLRTHARLGQEADPATDIDPAPLIRRAAAEIKLPDSFTLEILTPLPRLHCPPNGLLLLMQIVLSNAIKHHDSDHGTIRVSASQSDDTVHLLIEDDGPGIAAEYREKIFDMLFTLKPRDDVEGSGMGLATARKYTALAGGTICLPAQLDDQPRDAGATFCITLPAASGAAEPKHFPLPLHPRQINVTPAEATS